jgi:hypothetical protein
MALYLSPAGVMVQQLTNAGQPLSGGQLFIYDAGTTTPRTTYTDSTGVDANANPIILNSAGRLPTSVWIGSNLPHKLVLKDAAGNTLSTIDSLYGINDPYNLNAVAYGLPTGSGSANAQVVTNSQAQSSLFNGLEQWYIPSVTNTGATTLNVDTLGAKNVFNKGVALLGGELQQGQIVLLKYDGTQWNVLNPPLDMYGVSAGTNTITATIGNFVAYFNGMRIRLKMANTTTASATLNINSIGALNLYYSGGTDQLAAGTLAQNNIYEFVYNSSLNSGSGGFMVVNPSVISGSFTGTFSGFTTTVTGTIKYKVTGNKVDIIIDDNIAGTSNSSATMTMTGIPSFLVPSVTHYAVVGIEDGGGYIAGSVKINSTPSTWDFFNKFLSANFTASGTKGLPPTSFFYYLN